MGLDCGSCMSKYILCLFNFILFIMGIVIMGVGIWLLLDSKSFLNLTETAAAYAKVQIPQDLLEPKTVQQAAYILMGAGGAVVLISFMGYCGATRENRCLLTAYGVVVALVLILEIVAICLYAWYSSKADENAVYTLLNTTLTNYYGKDNILSAAWNQLMKNLHCCGVNNGTDFARDDIQWQGSTGRQVVPKACCRENADCTQNPIASNSYYFQGCAVAFIKMVEYYYTILIGVGVGLGSIELLGIIFAFCLVKAINNEFK